MAISDVVLVLGMHRSGTSSVAGVMSKLGAALPHTLMEGDQFNEKGYFESNVITEFNDALLAAAGSRWSDWRKFDSSWYGSQEALDFRRRAVDLFSLEFASVGVALLKDPRICRIAPFWLDVFRQMGIQPHVLIPIRSPVDVARSLSVDRGYAPGLSLRDGYLLWLRHVLDAEWHTRALPRSIFTWRSLLADWRSVYAGVARAADLKLESAASSLQADIDEFLTRDLVHHATDDEELCSLLGDGHWARRAYHAMRQLCTDGDTGPAFAALDDIRERFDEASGIFGGDYSEAVLGGAVLPQKAAKCAPVVCSAGKVAVPALPNEGDDPTGVIHLALLVHQAKVFVEDSDLMTGRVEKMAAGQRMLMDSNRRLLAELEAALETSTRLMTELQSVRSHAAQRREDPFVQGQISR